MALLTYLCYYFFIFPLSLLPHRVLFLLSDGFYVIIYHLLGYRKKVVFENLRNSFPGKSEKEIRKIAQKFYHHFCDVFFAETIKSFTVSARTNKNRLTITNLELINDLHKKGKSIIIACGHYGYWEFFSAVPLFAGFPYPLKAIYKVQKNKVVDTLLYKSRNKFGVELIPMEGVRRSFEDDRNRQNAIIFLGDQSPANPQNAYWTPFLNQETGVLFGTEKMAKMYDYAVVFGVFKPLKRGHYELVFSEIAENAKATGKGEITEMHTKRLEHYIQNDPAYWLWSHRRWKHKKPENGK